MNWAKLATAIILLGTIIPAPAIALAQQPANSPAQESSPERRIVCDRAPPPRGSHWVCDKPQRPCDCHLESNIPGRPIFGEGEPRPLPPPDAESNVSVSCHKLSIEKFIAPSYPNSARVAGIQGKVILHPKLNSAGDVISVTSEGPEALSKDAAAALKNWRLLRPPRPKMSSLTVVFNYVLREKDTTAETPATDVPANFSCEVEISAVPAPPTAPPAVQSQPPQPR